MRGVAPKTEQVEKTVRDETSWNMTRFCGPSNAMLRSLDFIVFTKGYGST